MADWTPFMVVESARKRLSYIRVFLFSAFGGYLLLGDKAKV